MAFVPLAGEARCHDHESNGAPEPGCPSYLHSRVKSKLASNYGSRERGSVVYKKIGFAEPLGVDEPQTTELARVLGTRAGPSTRQY